MEQPKEMLNSFTNMLDALGYAGGFPFLPSSPLSSVNPSFYNLRWYIISNDRQLLSQMYVEIALVQTLCDVPVDDALRGGWEIKSSQLNANDIEKIQNYFQEHDIIRTLGLTAKWNRLYGGAALLIITDQKPDTPFDLSKLKPDSKIRYEALDMWELFMDDLNLVDRGLGDLWNDPKSEYFMYYGHRVHKSRLLIMKGKEAPSFVKPRLRGWGMSEIEKLLRSLNSYFKNQDMVYELLDEAKIDVYKMNAFNSTLASPDGGATVANRIQQSNLLKNYNNALVLDAKDEYEQKQITFAGLADMLVQIRISIASDLRFPVTKLFGLSAAGFNSGEDDIENYNSMIESTIRSQLQRHATMLTNIACQHLFGIIPDDLSIDFKPLRILGAKDEEDIKTAKFQRALSARQAGEISALQFKQICNAGNLLDIEIDETEETFEMDNQAELDQ
jgi:phage-related protein (TIGR01555 family)